MTTENIVRTIVRDEIRRQFSELEERVAYEVRRSHQGVLKVMERELEASDKRMMSQLREDIGRMVMDFETIIAGSGVLEEIEQCAQDFLKHEDEDRFREGISVALDKTTQQIEVLLTVRRDGREPILAQVRAYLEAILSKRALPKTA